MKYSLILVVAFLFSCAPKEKMCRISGTLAPDVDVPFVILSIGKKQDTLYVTDHKFELEKHISEPTMSALIIPGSKKYPSFFFIENGDLTVDMTGLRTVVKGCPSQDLLYEYEAAGQGFPNDDQEAYTQNKLKCNFNIALKNSTSPVTKFMLNNPRLFPPSTVNLEYAEKIVELVEGDNLGFELTKLRDCIESCKARKGKFVDFIATDLTGTEKNITEQIGNSYTLIDIWASWCGPCRGESPHYKAALEQFKAEGFKVIAVSLDKDQEAWKTAIVKDGIEGFMHFNTPKATKETSLSVYKISGIPDNFLLDKDGMIVASGLRGKGLKNKLEQLYGDK